MIVVRPDTDASMLRKVYGSFPSGVVAVAARVEGELIGMAASSFTSVSMDPPLVSVCMQNSSVTWPRLAAACRIGLSVLSRDHNEACRKLAAKDGDRFQGVPFVETEDGAIFIEGASAHLDCTIEDTFAAGDHKIVLMRVCRVDVSPDREPLIFHASGFHRIGRICQAA